ncbi:hypothetical protein RvY_05026 [Ramazzottius varieornatus]|uniref:Uncharacterized protein n=1 Tax=Ramazzottius varieornatus TaxID=947166 RepID=A0A1D1UTL5_RAMVA|nr:hypothetical protein RvY_05026 [Ramazzottius varieornatus]
MDDAFFRSRETISNTNFAQPYKTSIDKATLAVLMVGYLRSVDEHVLKCYPNEGSEKKDKAQRLSTDF